MKNTFKLLLGIVILIFGVLILYTIAKSSFKRSHLIFIDGIQYYNEGIKSNSETKLLAAEQCFQNEINFHNEEAFPFMAHTKLLLGKYQESISYSLQSINLEYIKKDKNELAKLYLYLAFAYDGLLQKDKKIEYLKESSKLGNNEAKKILETIYK